MANPAAAMPETFGKDLIVSRHRYPLEHMILGVSQRGPGRVQGNRAGATLAPQACEQTGLLRGQTLALAYTHFFGRDLNQLVSARLADENGNFVVGRLASFFGNKLVNGFVTLPAPPAVFGEKFIGYPANLKSTIAALSVAAIIDLVTKMPHLAGKRISVDFGEKSPPLIDAGGLERLPTAFCAVVGQIGGNSMSVNLWIKFPAGVVMIDGEDEVSGHPVVIRPVLPNTSRGVGLDLLKGFGNGPFVRIYEAFVTSQDGHDGNRFRRGDREVV